MMTFDNVHDLLKNLDYDTFEVSEPKEGFDHRINRVFTLTKKANKGVNKVKIYHVTCTRSDDYICSAEYFYDNGTVENCVTSFKFWGLCEIARPMQMSLDMQHSLHRVARRRRRAS